MNHTKEPWYTEVDGKWSSIRGANGKMIIPSITNSQRDHDRIVACVNACSGIETKYLDGAPIKSMLKDAYDNVQHIEKLEQQNAELQSSLHEYILEGAEKSRQIGLLEREKAKLVEALKHIIDLYDAEGKAALTQKDMLWAMCVTAKKAISGGKV